MNNLLTNFFNGSGVQGIMGWWGSGAGGFLFIALLAWSLYWKGMALWKAAREGSRNWFVALLLIQTVGILDILYIYVFSKPKARKVT